MFRPSAALRSSARAFRALLHESWLRTRLRRRPESPDRSDRSCDRLQECHGAVRDVRDETAHVRIDWRFLRRRRELVAFFCSHADVRSRTRAIPPGGIAREGNRERESRNAAVKKTLVQAAGVAACATKDTAIELIR